MELLGDWRNAILILVVVGVLLAVAVAVRRRRRTQAPPPALDVAPALEDTAFLDSSHIIGGPIIKGAAPGRDAE
jgi:uncharacterized membrane protein affecting hemolysin expression